MLQQFKGRIFLIMLFSLGSVDVIAQTVLDKAVGGQPQWLRRIPTGESFNYYTGSAISVNSQLEAKEQAISTALTRILESRVLDVEVQTQTTVSEQITKSDSGNAYLSQDALTQEIVRTGYSSQITDLHLLEEYWQLLDSGNGPYHQYWVLMCVPKPGHAGASLKISQTYGHIPIIKSVALPGWGQFHKSEPRKGILFLGTESGLLLTSVLANQLSKEYNRRALASRDADDRNWYNTRSNRAYSVSLASGILAGAIHLYNIFDAVTAPGARIYAEDTQSIGLRMLPDPTGVRFEVRINLGG